MGLSKCNIKLLLLTYRPDGALLIKSVIIRLICVIRVPII